MSKVEKFRTEVDEGKHNFNNDLECKQISSNSLLCINLDPNPSLIPQGILPLEYLTSIIDETCDLVSVYKQNSVHYESLGLEGAKILLRTLEYIKKKDSAIQVILDAKKGDVRDTNKISAKTIFESYGYDAVTLNPLPGRMALQPFLDYKNKGCIVICHNSGKGTEDIQGLLTKNQGRDEPLYQVIAKKAVYEWNTNGNVSLVVGSTAPEILAQIRKIVGDIILLTPGLGTQGGVTKYLLNAFNSKNRGIIASVGRSIIYPRQAQNKNLYRVVREETIKWKDAINTLRII